MAKKKINSIGAFEIVDRNGSILARIYDEAISELLLLFSDTDAATDLNVLQNEANAILDDLQGTSNQYSEVSASDNYAQGINDAQRLMEAAGVSVDGIQEGLHETVVQQLADELALDFAKNIDALRNGLNSTITQAQRTQIRSAFITEQGREQISAEIQRILQSQGVSSLLDRGGRTWQLNTYADMLARTKEREAFNQGTVNRSLELGIVVFRVTFTGTDHAACEVWENQLVSESGQFDLPTIDDATAAGLFHPNCMHKIVPAAEAQLELEERGQIAVLADATDFYDSAEAFADAVAWRGEGAPGFVVFGDAFYAAENKALARAHATHDNFFAVLPMGGRSWLDITETKLQALNTNLRLGAARDLTFQEGLREIRKQLGIGNKYDGFRLLRDMDVNEFIDYSGKPWIKAKVPFDFDPLEFWSVSRRRAREQ